MSYSAAIAIKYSATFGGLRYDNLQGLMNADNYNQDWFYQVGAILPWPGTAVTTFPGPREVYTAAAKASYKVKLFSQKDC